MVACIEPSTKDFVNLRATLPQKRKTRATRAERKKKLKDAKSNKQSISSDQPLSIEIEVVLATPAPTPTLSIDSREGYIEKLQPSKIPIWAGPSKNLANEEEVPLDDIPKGLFFQD